MNNQSFVLFENGLIKQLMSQRMNKNNQNKWMMKVSEWMINEWMNECNKNNKLRIDCGVEISWFDVSAVAGVPEGDVPAVLEDTQPFYLVMSAEQLDALVGLTKSALNQRWPCAVFEKECGWEFVWECLNMLCMLKCVYFVCVWILLNVWMLLFIALPI